MPNKNAPGKKKTPSAQSAGSNVSNSQLYQDVDLPPPKTPGRKKSPARGGRTGSPSKTSKKRRLDDSDDNYQQDESASTKPAGQLNTPKVAYNDKRTIDLGCDQPETHMTSHIESLDSSPTTNTGRAASVPTTHSAHAGSAPTNYNERAGSTPTNHDEQSGSILSTALRAAHITDANDNDHKGESDDAPTKTYKTMRLTSPLILATTARGAPPRPILTQDVAPQIFTGTTNTHAFSFLTGSDFRDVLQAKAYEAARQYHIDISQALEEFRRFIILKVFVCDSAGDKLSPARLMAMLWQAAVLDAPFYRDLQEATGFRIDHRPRGTSERESAAHDQRLTVMTANYSALFRTWPIFEPESSQPAALHDRGNMTLKITSSTGRHCDVVAKLCHMIADENMLRASTFTFGDVEMAVYWTPLKEYGVRDRCTIHHLFDVGGC